MTHKYKKYIVFSYLEDHAMGGLDDAEGSYDTLIEAKRADRFNPAKIRQMQIIDRDTWEIVHSE